MIDLCNVPRIVRRCECGQRLAQCNHSDLCFLCGQRKRNAATRMKFEPIVKKVYPPSRMPSANRRKEILECMNRMSMAETAKHFHVALHTIVTIVKESGSRPLCPHGCGKTYHPGMCKGHPKYEQSRANLRKAHKQLAKPGPFTMADAAAFFGVEA